MLSETSRMLLPVFLARFAETGVKKVFAAECCGKILTSQERPAICSTCKSEVAAEEISTENYVARLD